MLNSAAVVHVGHGTMGGRGDQRVSNTVILALRFLLDCSIFVHVLRLLTLIRYTITAYGDCLFIVRLPCDICLLLSQLSRYTYSRIVFFCYALNQGSSEAQREHCTDRTRGLSGIRCICLPPSSPHSCSSQLDLEVNTAQLSDVIVARVTGGKYPRP